MIYYKWRFFKSKSWIFRKTQWCVKGSWWYDPNVGFIMKVGAWQGKGLEFVSRLMRIPILVGECKEVNPNTTKLIPIWKLKVISCFIILEQGWSNQTFSQLSFFYIVGKVLKITYLKWGHVFSIWIFETQVKWPIEWLAVKLTIRPIIIRMSNKRVKPFSIWEIDSFLERSSQKLQFFDRKLLNQNPCQGIMNPQKY